MRENIRGGGGGGSRNKFARLFCIFMSFMGRTNILGGLTVNIFATLHIQSCIFDYYLTYFLLFNFSGGQLREIGTRLNLPSPGIYFNT